MSNINIIKGSRISKKKTAILLTGVAALSVVGLGLAINHNITSKKINPDLAFIQKIINKKELASHEELTTSTPIDFITTTNKFLESNEKLNDDDKNFFYSHLDQFDVKVTFGFISGETFGSTVFTANKDNEKMTFVKTDSSYQYDIVWDKDAKTIVLSSSHSHARITGVEIIQKGSQEPVLTPSTLSTTEQGVKRILDKIEVPADPVVVTPNVPVDFVNEANKFLTTQTELTDLDKTFFYANLNQFDIKITFGFTIGAQLNSTVFSPSNEDGNKLVYSKENSNLTYEITWNTSAQSITLYSSTSTANIRGIEIIKKGSQQSEINPLDETQLNAKRIIDKVEEAADPLVVTANAAVDFVTEANKFLTTSDQLTDADKTFFYANLNLFDVKVTFGYADNVVANSTVFSPSDVGTNKQVYSKAGNDLIYEVTWNNNTQTITLYSSTSTANIKGIEIIKKGSQEPELQPTTNDQFVQRIVGKETANLGSATVAGNVIDTDDETTYNIRTQLNKYLAKAFTDYEWNFFKNNLDKFQISLFTSDRRSVFYLRSGITQTFDANKNTAALDWSHTGRDPTGQTWTFNYKLIWNTTSDTFVFTGTHSNGENEFGSIRGIRILAKPIS